MAYMYMPGATAVGITYDVGVVMASERRIAYGNFVVSKSTKKTFKITDYVGACCAGMVADMQVLAMQMRALTKIRKMELKREIPPNSVARSRNGAWCFGPRIQTQNERKGSRGNCS